jgi:hypothetical protein
MNHYYTDPLKAAWMAREHGFDLRTNNCRSPLPLWIFGRWIENKWDKKAVVAPESLPLLEPMEGDLASFGASVFGWKIAVVAKETNFPQTAISLEYAKQLHKEGKIEIIQRNGKAFFTPESEGK